MIYEYLCSDCGKKQEAFRTVANRNRSPRCCGKATTRIISATHHIAPLFTPYRAVGEEYGRIIRSRQEHQSYLRQHGYVEVGNDPSMAPPPFDPEARAQKERETKEALDQLKYAPDDVAA